MRTGSAVSQRRRTTASLMCVPRPTLLSGVAMMGCCARVIAAARRHLTCYVCWCFASDPCRDTHHRQKMRAVERAKEEEERKKREAEEAAAAEKARLDAMIYYDEPIISQAYASETQAATIEEVKTLDTQRRRPLLALQIVRPRKEFGARVKFLDKDGGEQNAADFRQQRNPNYDLTRAELHVGLQACAGLFSRHQAVGTQTTWFRTVNNSMQTEALKMPEDAEDIVSSERMIEALTTAANRCERALQQNETLNIFQDELALLDEEEIFVVGNKGENTIREARTFMDLEFSGNTSLVDIDWHPRSRQWLAAATAMNWAFEERVERSGRTTKSHILVYNFSEFSSQIVLEAPQEVLTFRWNPTNPTLIAAGCITGQVLLFDLAAAQDVLNRKQKRKSDSGVSIKCVGVSRCVCARACVCVHASVSRCLRCVLCVFVIVLVADAMSCLSPVFRCPCCRNPTLRSESNLAPCPRLTTAIAAASHNSSGFPPQSKLCQSPVDDGHLTRRRRSSS